MANTIDDIMPKILAKGLDVLRSRAVMPRVVNNSYSRDAARKGDTINIPDTASIGTRDVTPGVTDPTPVDSTRRTLPLTLDKWRQSDPFHLTDREMNEIDRNAAFIPQRVGEAAEALAVYMNQQLLNEYKKVYRTAGSVSDIPFSSGAGGISSASGARKELNFGKAPLTNRRGVLDFEAEASALDLDAFRSADQIFSKEVIMEGEIGRKLGIDWVADDDVPSHTTSAAGTILVDNVAGYSPPSDTSLKEQTIHIDGVTTAPDEGDVFSFAGHSGNYVVKSVANAALPDIDVTFAPALREAIVDNEAITFVASHKVNLVFHRDAFAFATRPLVSQTIDLALGNRILSFTDPRTGLTLRLEVKREHKQVVWEFDVLFGVLCVRPETAVRLLGPPA